MFKYQIVFQRNAIETYLPKYDIQMDRNNSKISNDMIWIEDNINPSSWSIYQKPDHANEFLCFSLNV